MVDFKKYSQKDRMAFVNALLESVYENIMNREADPGILQDAVYAQIFINRIVFDLNEKQQKGEDDATD